MEKLFASILNLKMNSTLKIILLSALILGVLVFAPQLLNLNSPQQSGTTTSQSAKTADTQAFAKFMGTNFDVLPKMTKIPVTFDRIVDGDTIIVKLNQKQIKTRYLMIDTPESVKEGVTPQPFGKEAAKRNEALLKGAKNLYLMLDKGESTDEYGRALSYIYADDVLVAEQLVSEGYASVSYVNPPNNSYEAQLRKAQAAAKKQKLNIWSIPNYVNDKGKFKVQ